MRVISTSDSVCLPCPSADNPNALRIADLWQADWQIDSLDTSRRRCFCSVLGSDSRFTHFGKLFLGDIDSPAYDSFCRQATMAIHVAKPCVPLPVGGRLESELPMLVFASHRGLTLEEWLEFRQPLSLRVDILTKLLDALIAIHSAGYIHAVLTKEHVFVLPDGTVQLIGLSRCHSVGQPLWLSDGVDSGLEATSAIDIGSLVSIMVCCLGDAFADSNLAKAMLCDDLASRPTSQEIKDLLQSVLDSLQAGWQAAA